MMLVRTYLAPSAIEGLGVFSSEIISKGQLIWRFDERFDQVIRRDQIETFPAYFQEFLERYSYAHHLDEHCMVLEADDGRYMNHSDTPNIDFSEPDRGVAFRDIPSGEELTCDYAYFTLGPVTFQPPRQLMGMDRCDSPQT